VALRLDRAWALASAWYSAPRNRPEWRRFTREETQEVFNRLGLTGSFWGL
jgi:hypothetical protein